MHGILGVHCPPGAVKLAPCIPSAWDLVELVLTCDSSSIFVKIVNPDRGFCKLESLHVDGELVSYPVIRFSSDAVQPRVVIQMGTTA